MSTHPDTPTLYFQGGTLVIDDLPPTADLPAPFQYVRRKWRCEAYHYPAVREQLRGRNLRDRVPQWEDLPLHWDDDRTPHDYQKEALQTWHTAGRRGTIVLPTGAGKTFVALRAIHQVGRSAVVVAPTIDLLHQWYARLVNAFAPAVTIGVYYGGEKDIRPLTVTTYHSAGDLIADCGHRFALLVYDEVHHLPAPNWGETALMCPAPFRLGLTATYPEQNDAEQSTAEQEPSPPPQNRVAEDGPIYHTNTDRVQLQPNGRWRIADLIGPVVYQRRINDLVGKQLAEYRTERVRVNLTEAEQERYDADYAIYAGYFRRHNLMGKYGRRWYMELLKRSAYDQPARRAMLARHRLQNLLAGAENKIAAAARLLAEHTGESILIFTENNDVVYDLSRRFLIPALTHETKTAERKATLDRFRSGEYPVLVTSKVLNEGVDVPEAKVALVLGGTAGAREYIQRLGRVLRKVGQRQATLYEIIVRNTVDEGRAQRRRPSKEVL